jgi:phosphomannomutase
LTLIKSISGFRGTIGGRAGDNLTPQDIVECTAAFGQWVLQTTGRNIVVTGRDGRISGEIVSQLVIHTLRSVGIHVIDLGLSTTPTVEMAVPAEQAGGGIILTASHNAREWNALKLLNHKGEFISAADGKAILDLVEANAVEYAPVDQLGTCISKDTYINKHIKAILSLKDLIDVEAVQAKKYKVVVDAINSTGALSVPPLLEALGCTVITINEEINGQFSHNPEPLREHLGQLATEVKRHKAHLGIAVDPDVDRLVLMCEDGELFGEEYTLVSVADYVLSKKGGGNTVSNLSSTRALRDITARYGGQYYAAAVGEVHVVEKMKAVGAVIGGEGNGGVILPELHYGRDALAGIALFLSLLAQSGKQISTLRQMYPRYEMFKGKMDRTPHIELQKIFVHLQEKYKKTAELNTEDGLKLDFEDGWVHLRPSNTEPIIRVYSESISMNVATHLARKIMEDVRLMVNG